MLPKFTLHHGGIAVSNLKESIAFYRRTLGFEVDTQVRTSDGQLDIVHMKKGDDYLELLCHQTAEPLPEFARDNASDFRVVGTKHISFSTDHPRQMHRHLNSEKVDGLTPIYDNNPHYYYFFFRDPDGIAIEIVSPRKHQ